MLQSNLGLFTLSCNVINKSGCSVLGSHLLEAFDVCKMENRCYFSSSLKTGARSHYVRSFSRAHGGNENAFCCTVPESQSREKKKTVYGRFLHSRIVPIRSRRNTKELRVIECKCQISNALKWYVPLKSNVIFAYQNAQLDNQIRELTWQCSALILPREGRLSQIVMTSQYHFSQLDHKATLSMLQVNCKALCCRQRLALTLV